MWRAWGVGFVGAVRAVGLGELEDGHGGAAGELVGVGGLVGADDAFEGGDGGGAGAGREELETQAVDLAEGVEEGAEAREAGPLGELVGGREQDLGDLVELDVLVEEHGDEAREEGGVGVCGAHAANVIRVRAGASRE